MSKQFVPPSYRVQSCCGTCARCFVLREHDDANRYFCHADGSERPRCGSVAMEEVFGEAPGSDEAWPTDLAEQEKRAEVELEHYMQQRDVWDVWAHPREVDREGICDEWVPYEEGT